MISDLVPCKMTIFTLYEEKKKKKKEVHTCDSNSAGPMMSFLMVVAAGIGAVLPPLKTYDTTISRFDNRRVDIISCTTRACVLSICIYFNTSNRFQNINFIHFKENKNNKYTSDEDCFFQDMLSVSILDA